MAGTTLLRHRLPRTGATVTEPAWPRLGAAAFWGVSRWVAGWRGGIDLGPGAGHDGGRVVFEGAPADLVAARSTLTGEHLAAYVGT